MSSRTTPDPAWVAALEALARVLADPRRLVEVLAGAADPDDGAARLGTAFGLTGAQARVVLDNSFAHLTRARREAVVAELEALRAPWGPPLHLAATVRRGTAFVTTARGDLGVGGHPGRELAAELGRLVAEEVARPHRRPVVVTMPDGTRVTALPDRSVQVDGS